MRNNFAVWRKYMAMRRVALALATEESEGPCDKRRLHANVLARLATVHGDGAFHPVTALSFKSIMIGELHASS
jgi:hypothetical protein